MAKIFVEIDTTNPEHFALATKPGVRVATGNFTNIADFLDQCYEQNAGAIPLPYRDANGDRDILAVAEIVTKDTNESAEERAQRLAEGARAREMSAQFEAAILGLATRRAGETVH